MTPDGETAYRFLVEKPAQYGNMLGYPDLRDDLHGHWIRKMVLGHADMTLQAHRGSYKTTCDCIALSINILLRGDMNSIFMRKTEADIKEVIVNVDRILREPVTQELYRALTGQQLGIIRSTNSEITTTSYTAPRGAAQLLGIGISVKQSSLCHGVPVLMIRPPGLQMLCSSMYTFFVCSRSA